MSSDIRKILEGWPLFDNAIVEHHFTPYLRDYDVVVDASAAAPDGTGSYIEGRYRYRFTHCVVAHVTTDVDDEVWRKSWEDVFTDYEAWEEAGEPEGFVWGVCYSAAYPGLEYIGNSLLAREWSERLRKPMHEVKIETNGHNIRLVFHDVTIRKIA